MALSDSIKFNESVDQIVDKLSTADPNNVNSRTAILTFLKEMNGNILSLQSELVAAKQEICGLKQCIKDYECKVKTLEQENSKLRRQVNDLESTSRATTLLLSGPAISLADDSSPSQMLTHSLTKIKDVYNFDLSNEDVQNCQRIRGKDNVNDKILLTLNNTFKKNELMSTVIQKDKKEGVSLNVNEYLSSYNSQLFYNLRQLRKKYNGKIFACFTRNGRIFYKIKKTSRPMLLKDEEDLSQMTAQLQNHGFLMDRATENVQQAQRRTRSNRLRAT